MLALIQVAIRSIVNVELTEYAVHSVMKELGRCLNLFRSLHTVKIRVLSTATSDNAARSGFAKCAYTVQSALLSRAAFPMLLSCPDIRNFQPIQPFDAIVHSHFYIPPPILPLVEKLDGSFFPLWSLRGI